MIFKQAQQVVDGRKRQTRRPVKPGEWAFMDVDDPAEILSVIGANGRLKWQVGKTYAAQPGRGKKGIGRTPPIEAIRRERLVEITPEDALAEGVLVDFSEWGRWYRLPGEEGDWSTAVGAFEYLWNSMYPLKAYRYQGFRWRDNPDVWVIVFEEVDD